MIAWVHGQTMGWTLMVALGLGCPGPQTTEEAEPMASAEKELARISVGTGGGITGMAQGHEIRSDLSIHTWRLMPRAATPEMEPVGQVSEACWTSLLKAALTAPSLARSVTLPGNMSTIFRMEHPKRRVQSTWAVGQEPDDVQAVMVQFNVCLEEVGR